MKLSVRWTAGPLPPPCPSRLALFCVGLLSALAANADTWTNLAGHVVTASLVGVEGDQITLQNTNGRTWRIPLSSLNPADRQRALEQTETEPLPAGLRVPFDQATDDIRHAAQFLQGGKISRDAYLARCEQLIARFELLALQDFKDRGGQPDRALLDRLKRRLLREQHRAETAPRP